MLIIVVPASVRIIGVSSPTIIIFLNESSILRNEASSCLNFSSFKELYNICDVIIPNTGDLMTVVDKVYSVISSEEEGNEQQ